MIDQSALHAAGPEAAHLDHLWWIFFWTCAAVYVLVVAFFAAAWIRGRRNAAPDVSPETEKRLGTAIGVATVVSVIGLLALLTISVIGFGKVTLPCTIAGVAVAAPFGVTDGLADAVEPAVAVPLADAFGVVDAVALELAGARTPVAASA